MPRGRATWPRQQAVSACRLLRDEMALLIELVVDLGELTSAVSSDFESAASPARVAEAADANSLRDC
jgi:hypothetical protein